MEMTSLSQFPRETDFFSNLLIFKLNKSIVTKIKIELIKFTKHFIIFIFSELLMILVITHRIIVRIGFDFLNLSLLIWFITNHVNL